MDSTYSKRIRSRPLLIPHLPLLRHISLPSRLVHPIIEPIGRIRSRSPPGFVAQTVDIEVEEVVAVDVFVGRVDVDRRTCLRGGQGEGREGAVGD